MTGEQTAPQTSQQIAQRVRARTLAERKRRILRNAVLFVIITLGMIYIALRQRDAQAVRNITEIGRLMAADMQRVFDQEKRLPDRAPNLGPQFRAIASRFVFNPFYGELSRSIKPVAALYSTGPISLFLNPPGRVVVLFDGKNFRAEWIPETDFHNRRAAWGLGAGG